MLSFYKRILLIATLTLINQGFAGPIQIKNTTNTNFNTINCGGACCNSGLTTEGRAPAKSTSLVGAVHNRDIPSRSCILKAESPSGYCWFSVIEKGGVVTIYTPTCSGFTGKGVSNVNVDQTITLEIN